MKGPFRCWGTMTLLALACASVGGCTPSSGDGAAADNMDATDKGAIAPAAQADVARVPVANVATPATLVARSLPAKPVRPVPAAPSLDLPASNAAATATAFPAEVTNFMVDRDGCDHFRGEEPYDAERAAYLEQSIRDLCTGSDAKLAKLRRRYAENPDVMAALGNYEDQIGSPEEP